MACQAMRSLLLLFLFATPTVFGDEWISLGGREGQRALVDVRSEGDSVRIEVRIPGFHRTRLQAAGEEFDRLRIAGAGQLHREGFPELPVVTVQLGAARGARPRFEVTSARSRPLDLSIRPVPFQRPGINDERWTRSSRFRIDQEVYQRATLFPEELVTVTRTGTARGVDLYEVALAPIRWIPSTQQARVTASFDVTVTFDGGDRFASARTYSQQPDAVGFVASLGNSRELRRILIAKPIRTAIQGADYLIITTIDMVPAAERIAELRQRRNGLRTKIVTTNVIGQSAGEIEAYIDTAMKVWTLKPLYLLLIGDTPRLPTMYRMKHPYYDPSYGIPNAFGNIPAMVGSDHAYACTDGPDDHVADLFYGRLPGASRGAVDRMIDKIIEYEDSPPTDDEFYSTVSLIGYFQDQAGSDGSPPDGREDRGFIRISEVVRDQWRARNKEVETLYHAEPGIDPALDQYGDPLRTELLRSAGYPWNVDASRINAIVNGGRFLVGHIGHGYEGGWGTPMYDAVENIPYLANAGRYPVVISANCSTGHFDNETDQDEYGRSDYDECFSERMLLADRSGAVAVISSTRITFGLFQDILYRSIHAFLAQGATLGGAVWGAKQVLDIEFPQYADSFLDLTDLHHEMIHVYGDPAMRLRLSAPPALIDTGGVHSIGPKRGRE